MDRRIVQSSLTGVAGLTDVHLTLLGLNRSADVYGGATAAGEDQDLAGASRGIEHGEKLRTTGDGYATQGLENHLVRVNGRAGHQVVPR